MDEAQMALLIPILGIVFGIGVAIVAIVAGHRLKISRLEFRHRERLAALDRGLELPPDTDGFDPAARRPRYLLRGLVWLFVGGGIVVALNALSGPDEALLGVIPAGVGLAYLIFYFVEGRHEAQADAGRGPGELPR